MELIKKLKEKEGMKLQNNSKMLMKCKDLFHNKEKFILEV
jgi:hypothetical protein